MKSSEHKRIQELIPEFLDGSLPESMRKDIGEHLGKCSDCADIVVLLSGVSPSEVPDPGELFWNTLPGKIVLSLREDEIHTRSKIFFSPFRIASATIVLCLIIVTSFVLFKKGPSSPVPQMTADPFSAAIFDYSGLTETDIPLISGQLQIEVLEGYSSDPVSSSCYREFASLSAGELETVYESLKKQDAGG